MNLFQLGNFTLHSGATSAWKIDCDALTDDDLAALAVMAAEQLSPFSIVVGVERGGVRFAQAMHKHVDPDGIVLIVDDVLTTGASMEEIRKRWSDEHTMGLVIFARSQPPGWVTALFQM